MECTVDRAPPDHTIFISCPAFGVKNEELSIINPLNEEVTLKVSYLVTLYIIMYHFL